MTLNPIRRLLVALPFAFFLQTALAQDDFSFEIVQDIAMTREQLFNNASLWLAESTASSKSVIDLKDKDLGVIIGNANAEAKAGWGTTTPMQFKIRIDVKDNKYRLMFSQVAIYTGYGFKPIEQANRDILEPKARELFEQIAGSFSTYLSNASKVKPW